MIDYLLSRSLSSFTFHLHLHLRRTHSDVVIGGVIVTPDFLKTLNLEGPSHTSLIGTVTALYDVGYVALKPPPNPLEASKEI